MSMLMAIPRIGMIGKSLITTCSYKTQCKLNYVQLCKKAKFFSTDPGKATLEKIYEGSLTPKMKAVKIFSLTTSLSGIAAQPILMEQGAKIGGTPMVVFLCTFVGFFTFVTPLLLHFITKKYVTEMHYDPNSKEYTAATISLFLQKIETKFKLSDVKVPDVPGMFTTFTVGKTRLFVDPSQFTNIEHYVEIMGFNKPIDFKLDIDDNPSTHKKDTK